MHMITTTELRTKTTQLVKALALGEEVSLIHRSRVIGRVRPEQEPKVLTQEDIEELQKLAKQMNLPKLSDAERERRYRKHLMEKYGKYLS